MAVHPHRCGDNSAYCLCADGLSGPSPQVWGQRPGLLNLGRKLRSIPTGVGTTA